MTEKQIAELDTKVKMLYFKLHQTDEIVENREWQSLERHQSSIASIVSAVDTLKSAVEEKKFTKGESEDTIKTWSGESNNTSRKPTKQQKEFNPQSKR